MADDKSLLERARLSRIGLHEQWLPLMSWRFGVYVPPR